MKLSARLKAFGLIGIILISVSQLIYFFLPAAPFFILAGHLALGGILIGLFLIGGGAALIKKRNELRDSKRRNRSFLKFVLLLSIVAILNLILLNKELFQYDSTAEKIHTLSPEVNDLVSKLPGKLTIRAFYLGGVIPDEAIYEELQALAKIGVEVITIDPESDILSLEKYGISQQETLHFSLTTSAGEERVARAAHLKTEDQLILILKKLARTNARTAFYVTGHGESALDDKLEKGSLFFKETLEGENLEVKSTSLSGIDKIAEEVRALIINAPKENFSEHERRVVAEYISRGGNLILFNEPRTSNEVSLLAKPFGIEVGDDLVIEPEAGSNSALGIEVRLSMFSARSPITRGFTKSALFSGTSSVKLVKEDKADVEIAFSSEKSWAEKNLSLLFGPTPQARKDLEDLPGPVPVIASYDGTLANQRFKSRVIVFGDSDFIQNAHLRELANGELLLNSINWILGDNELQVGRNKSMSKTLKKLSYEERERIILLGGIFLPEILALIAIFLWYKKS